MMLPLLSSPSQSSKSPRRRTSPLGMRSSSNRNTLNREDSNISEKEKPRTSYTASQAYILAAFCSALAAAATAFTASYCYSMSFDTYADHLVEQTTRSFITHRRVRSLNALETNFLEEPDEVAASSLGVSKLPVLLTAATLQDKTEVTKFPLSSLPRQVIDQNGPRPHIAWLMSFPNRYEPIALYLELLFGTAFWTNHACDRLLQRYVVHVAHDPRGFELHHGNQLCSGG